MHHEVRRGFTSPVAGLGLLAVLVALHGTAAYADAGAECCLDLEQRIAELEATTVRKGNRAVSLQVAGYLNEAVMYWNDGFEDNIYIVTNETERSRIAFTMEAKISPKWTAGGILEFGVHSNREGALDQFSPLSPLVSLNPDVRYANWWLEHEDVGRIEVGKLKTATFHITHMMLTETWYFARFGIGTWVGVDGAGFYLRKTNGMLTDGANPLRWGDIDAHANAADPGEGLRTDGVKYATPDIAGFNIQTSYAGAGGADVALRYTGEIGAFEITAGIGFADYWKKDIRRCAVLPGAPRDVDCQTLGMSATVMHMPTGLYLYGGYSQQRDLNRQALFQAPVDDTDRSYYLQAGVERKFIAAGKTTIFAEFERDEVGAGVNARTGGILNTTELGPPGDSNYDRMAASKIDTWGLGIGQGIDDAEMELYISGRVFKAEVETSATGLTAGSVTTPIEDFLMILGGAKIGF